MSKPVGGRGKQAPYGTTHLRVPIPIKDKLEAIIEDYRRSVVDGVESEPSTILPLEQAKELAVRLLRSKSAKLSTVLKLLTGIYGEEVNEDDLK
jgi:hypothetical protein